MLLVLERKYGTARHQPGCAVLRLITWSRMFPRMPHVGVGGISRLVEDQRVTSIEVDKALILC